MVEEIKDKRIKAELLIKSFQIKTERNLNDNQYLEEVVDLFMELSKLFGVVVFEYLGDEENS